MKIFVGHSFAEVDKVLVDTIISFLAKKGMSCQTGERAQNKSVSEKVKSRIDNNEIFLGIFTIDQQIKQPEEKKARESLIAKFIPSKKPVSQINPPIFTTSNWVLQESGYAIAKGKKIILMVENGIHRFPELQGDGEIIPFDRNLLDKPFLKLIEMLFDNQMGQAGPQTAPSATEAKEDSKPDEINPPPFMEMFDAHEQKDIKKVEEIYKNKIRSTLEPKQQKFWDALILRWQYSAGEADKFSELEKMYNETKEFDIGVQIGLCYEGFDKYREAREFYLKCLQDITDNQKKFDCYLRIARCYLEEKDYERAMNTVLELVSNPIFSQEKERAFLDLVKIAEEKKDDYLYFVFAEKALDINPVNNGLRFKVAYKYSNTDKEDLALYHYKKLLENTEDTMALNNIGVAYSGLDMPSKGVKFYEKASLKKNTLGNANLAYKYLNVGFIEQADKLLKSADELSREGIEVHENIGYAKKALKEKTEAEDKKEAEVLAGVAKAHNFKIRHSEAFCIAFNHDIDLSGKWQLGEWGEVEISLNKQDGSFVGVDSKDFEVPSAPPFGLGLTGLFYTPTVTIKTRVVEIKGSVHNLAGKFTLKVSESIKGSTPSLLYSGDDVYNSNGFLIADASGNLIDVMEEVKNKERTYNQYKKVIS